MKYDISTYDTKDAIADDRNHLWHHISQHKVLEEKDPLMIVEGKGMRVWDSHPRVYLPIEDEGEVQCPYCGATYSLVD